MIRKIACFFLWSMIAAVPVRGADLSEIILEDGSIVRAEVVSLQDNLYTLRSPSLGEFKLDAVRVTQIRRFRPEQITSGLPSQDSGQPLSFSSQSLKSQVESTQAQLLNNPAALQEAMSMASDPEFQKLMEDPEAVAALKSMDMETLLKNPQFMAIMQNPRMQGLATRLKKEQ